MKIWRVLLISVFALTLVFAAGCTPGTNSAAQTNITVQTGNLAISVNGTGKINYENDAKLNFGTAGKVEQVSVKEGELVTKGTILAKLNTDGLELGLSQAKTAESQAKVALTQAESALASAQFFLDKTEDVKEIKDEITRLELNIISAKQQLSAANRDGDSSEVKYLREQIAEYEIQIVKEQQDLAELLGEAEYTGVITYDIAADKYGTITVQDIRQKQAQVNSAQSAVDLAKQTLAQTSLGITISQRQLNDATIVAPFDGIVATLNIKTGDFVGATGTTSAPIYMVDINSLEISTEIDEIDIAEVDFNQKAIISLDALPGETFEGIVDTIAVTPVVKQNSGVVVYEVKVRFAGTPPKQAKAGMSTKVDIVTQEKNDVLIVPNKSIKRNSQAQTIVYVIKDNKQEERVIVTGQTDGINTEIVSGITAGEVIQGQ